MPKEQNPEMYDASNAQLKYKSWYSKYFTVSAINVLISQPEIKKQFMSLVVVGFIAFEKEKPWKLFRLIPQRLLYH